MIRCGLPTQEEINRWDDGQRARGHQMVRVIPREHYVCHVIERKGYQVDITHFSDFGLYLAEALIENRLVSATGKGKSKLEALQSLAGELGVSL